MICCYNLISYLLIELCFIAVCGRKLNKTQERKDWRMHLCNNKIIHIPRFASNSEAKCQLNHSPWRSAIFQGVLNATGLMVSRLPWVLSEKGSKYWSFGRLGSRGGLRLLRGLWVYGQTDRRATGKLKVRKRESKGTYRTWREIWRWRLAHLDLSKIVAMWYFICWFADYSSSFRH